MGGGMMHSSRVFPGVLSPNVRASANGHWAGSLSYKAERAWQAARGIEHRVQRRDDAPCPRCGAELRAGTVAARGHDRANLEPFCEWDGVDVRAGFRCRVRA